MDISLVLTTLHPITAALGHVVSEIPPIGDAKAPPQAEKFTELMQYVKWICLALCGVAIMMVGASMAWARGHGGEGFQMVEKFGKVIFGIIVVAGAGSILAWFA